jgi:hypothetical protein
MQRLHFLWVFPRNQGTRRCRDLASVSQRTSSLIGCMNWSQHRIAVDPGCECVRGYLQFTCNSRVDGPALAAVGGCRCPDYPQPAAPSFPLPFALVKSPYCITAQRERICTESTRSMLHDVIGYEPCNCSFPSGSLQQLEHKSPPLVNQVSVQHQIFI